LKNNLNRLWEEADVTKLKALWQNLPEETVENHGKLQQGKPMPISQLKFNQHPPFLIQAKLLLLQTTCWGISHLDNDSSYVKTDFATLHLQIMALFVKLEKKLGEGVLAG